MLNKGYDSKGSVEETKCGRSGREPEGIWLKDELFGGKPPVVK
jgi:hypothetical protein